MASYDVPILIAVLWWGSVALSATVSIGLIIIYIGRALGLAYDEGCLYSVKSDFEIRLFRVRPGKYERPKEKNPVRRPTRRLRDAIITLISSNT